jgi:hypothetical protein
MTKKSTAMKISAFLGILVMLGCKTESQFKAGDCVQPPDSGQIYKISRVDGSRLFSKGSDGTEDLVESQTGFVKALCP